MKKRRKTYLGIFYGSNRKLNEVFINITDNDFIRYIVTNETLICRFKSKLEIQEIEKIFKEQIISIPFFVFPINHKRWIYSLPLEVENNLLTDNPIIKPKREQPDNPPANFFINLLNELRKRQEKDLQNERSFNHWINDNTKLSEMINDDGFFEINGFNITKENMGEILNDQLNSAINDEKYEDASNIKKKLDELNNIIKHNKEMDE